MRIISLSPSFTEIMEVLGLSRDLAAVTQECSISLATPERVGSTKTLEIQKILSLQPDVIVTAYAENRPEELRPLQEKFRVISYKVNSIPALITAISDLGKIFECQDKAKSLIQTIYQEWPAPGREAVPTVALLWPIPFLTVNQQTYISNLIEAAGGVNLFREDPTPEVAIELEDMADKNPDLILLPTHPFPFDESQRDFFLNIPVFSKKRVELIDGNFFSIFGPRTAKALRHLRGLMSQVKQSKN